ncbi:MAG TPA: M20/M25/M40 family metallo-hydrolase [Pyrinomonadaceae bacterium]|nr:M20/M25/M40 family metallo-hydrolase [Pyrinomonadaceae bacterium]
MRSGRRFLSAVLLLSFIASGSAFAQSTSQAVYSAPKEAIDKIREEGLGKNSQVMQTLSYMTDVIGGRLTGSPNMKRANEWTRDTMIKWGMNGRLEAWGPFGRGWSLERFTAQVESPQLIPLIAYPKAWSPSTDGLVKSEAVLFEARTDADFDKYKGKLKGKIVFGTNVRPLKPIDKPLMQRLSDEELAKMANAPAPDPSADPFGIKPEQIKQFVEMINFQARKMRFIKSEGAALFVETSGGSGGTMFVQGASTGMELSPNTKSIEDFFTDPAFNPQNPAAADAMMPQLTVAAEDYNRIVRMIGFDQKPVLSVEIKANFSDKDQMSYNTIAEIPGSDPSLKDEIVMLGGHLDSWHSSTGATDNGAGCAVAMEAARIIIATGQKPRRTIRVALWSGEEQGLYGSAAFVKQHVGEKTGGNLVKGAEWDKISAYYNLDNGTGKIRGVYLQGNAAVKPIFAKWLEPFADLGAQTLTLANTGGTDHLSFDMVGVPGFQFIQDPVEYETRTHHSNQDNFDRIQAEDMKQAATIMAAFVYQTAMMDGKLPRKASK